MQYVAAAIERQAEDLAARFASAKPFRHLVLDGFFTPDYAARLLAEFPPFERGNHLNEAGLPGNKSVVERIRALGPAYAALDDLVQSPAFLRLIERLTGIEGLLYDPYYLGGGTHDNRHGQDLDPHVDFNRHPIDGTHRRLNLIVYLNHDWDPDWGGLLELHSDPRSPDDQIVRIVPSFNRAVIFETTEWSWHGFDRIRLPPEQAQRSRKSIALYFYSKTRPQEELADPHSTIYIDRPLPDYVRAGHTLSAEEAEEIRILTARRDQHRDRLYRDLTRLYKELETARSASAMERVLRLGQRVWMGLKRLRGSGAARG